MKVELYVSDWVLTVTEEKPGYDVTMSLKEPCH